MIVKTKKRTKINVHASSLPRHQDCPRSWAANNLKEVGEHWELAPRGIGSLIGDLCHNGTARMLIDKQLKGSWDWQIAFTEQVTELDRLLKGSITWDATTKERGVAIKQVERMLFEVNRGLIPHAKVHAVETLMKADYSDFIRLIGKVDLIELDKELGYSIPDHKFGKHLGVYQAQLGAYKMLLEAQPEVNERELAVVNLLLNWIQRVSLKSTQPKVIQISYSLVACENAARKQLDMIEQEVKDFDASGDPWAFNANPSSKTCTQGGCRAWGTKWCDQWIDLDDKETDQ